MIIALGALLFVFVLICLFLRIDIGRAVTAKEAWKKTALDTERQRQKAAEIIHENNTRYQELSDKLEDEQLTVKELIKELANSDLQRLFTDEIRDEQEKTITFWIRQFNQACEDRRDDRKRYEVVKADLRKRYETIVADNRELAARCRNIADALGVTDEDASKVGFLWNKVLELKGERDTLKKERDAAIVELNNGVRELEKVTKERDGMQEISAELMIERDDLRDRLVKGGAEREEERKAWHVLQKDTALFRHNLGEAIGCGFGASLADEELIERVRTLRADMVKTAADLVDVTRERDEVRTKLADDCALTAVVAEGLTVRHRYRAYKVRNFVREFVRAKGLNLSTLQTPEMDRIVQQLDDSVIKPTRGPAEDLAPPAQRPRKNKSKRQAVH